MNPLNVKSTMVHRLLDLVAPHYCCSCGEIGSLLCESCKYDITSEPFVNCLLCGRPSLSNCTRFHPDIQRAWCAGERSGGLEALINQFKFSYAEAAYRPLSDVMLAALPELPQETIVVPVPTIRTHIRQRGYDHTLLLARAIAEKRRLELAQPLTRRTTTIQRGANRKTRIAQAKGAFAVKGSLQESVPYLLIDDVVTTGSTLVYAAKAMKDAGATTIWAAAAARQPLD